MQWSMVARTVPKSKNNINKNLKISNSTEISCDKTTNIISESKENINTDLKNSCNTITSTVSESKKNINIDSINSRKYEIESTIKKVCIDKATVVKNAFMTAYNIIKPKNAKLIADEEYKKTYELFYDKLSTKYKLEGLNIRIIDILEYQLTDDEINVQNEENLSIYEETSSMYEKRIEKQNEERIEKQNEERIEKQNEEKLSTYQVNNKIIDTIDIQNQINKIAIKFAKSIIINQEINNKTHLEIYCKDVILGYVNNKPIYPNKFLDPTYVKDTYHTSSHYFFKKIFIKILKDEYLGNYNLHVKFSKDLNDNMIFHIYFADKKIINYYIKK